MTAAIIEVSDLHHTYMAGTPLEKTSLRGIDLAIHAGEIVALIGSTGSGKSTLLQHLNGLIRPQRGQVRVMGMDLGDRRTDLRAIRRVVGLVFQRPGEQLFEQYVGDDVAYGPRLAGLLRRQLRERVRGAMEQVDLDFDAYRDRLTSTLSGGERRKVGLAGVLAMRPQVLLLDEPTAGLDPVTHLQFLRRVRSFQEQGTTIVFATHDMEDVALLAQRVYVMHEGQIVVHGATREVFLKRSQLRQVDLDVPVAAQIVDALSGRGLCVPADVLNLDEAERVILDLLHGEASS